jgi:DNA-binding Lrp family transcriptional regulator
MTDELDYRLIAAVQQGLPIAARPYAAIAEQLATSEQDVLERLARLKHQGLIKRWGVVVKHRQLGYRANAMIVMDIPDQQVAEIGRQISRHSFVNLCYQRPRQGETWPYNLYCMIHGKSRDTVLQQWAELVDACGLTDCAHEVLFSRRCFKQRGALYRQSEPSTLAAHHG